MRITIATTLLACLSTVGCDNATTDRGIDPAQPTKDDVRGAKADGQDYCEPFGFEAGCDICVELDWYGDDICDEVCSEPDPDCAVGRPNESYECLGLSSGTFFDLQVVDVGDQEGSVVVNDGGAPRTHSAHYTQEGAGGHAFLFGFDDFNGGHIDRLHSIEIASVSSAFAEGVADYDGVQEAVVCYDTGTIDPDVASDLECRSSETGTFFDLDIVDVGDQEGTVVVNDGGAPESFFADYRQRHENGSVGHRFIFGFEDVNAGITDELYAINVDEISASFATGSVEFGQASGLVCFMPKN